MMLHFEVQIPYAHNPQQRQTLQVEAPNWLLALRDGLQQVGETVSIRNISCDVLDEQQLTVTVTETGQMFTIRELAEGEAKAPTPPVEETGAKTEAFLTPIALEEFSDPGATLPPDAPPMTIEEARPLSPSSREESILPPPPVEAIRAPAPQEPDDDDVPYALDSTPTSYDMSPPPPEPSVEEENPVSRSIRAISEDVGSSVGAPPLKAPSPPPPAETSNESPAFAPEPPPAPEPVESTSFGANPLLQEAPAPSAPPQEEPVSKNFVDVSGSTGKYSPGMTTEILADAFMRAMEIYDYGEDRKAAMRFTLELGLNNVNAVGGCVFLTDPNAPEQLLWVEVAIGPRQEELVNFRIPFGRGVAGSCAQTSTSILIGEASEDSRFDDDILRQLDILPGSILCVPIQSGSRILGALQLYKQPGERPFTQGELSICNYLAHIAGEYMDSLG